MMKPVSGLLCRHILMSGDKTSRILEFFHQSHILLTLSHYLHCRSTRGVIESKLAKFTNHNRQICDVQILPRVSDKIGQIKSILCCTFIIRQIIPTLKPYKSLNIVVRSITATRVPWHQGEQLSFECVVDHINHFSISPSVGGGVEGGIFESIDISSGIFFVCSPTR